VDGEERIYAAVKELKSAFADYYFLGTDFRLSIWDEETGRYAFSQSMKGTVEDVEQQ
jgi:hypothetical protein